MLQRPLEPKQYTSFRFTTHLLDAGIDASIGSVGDALDNALMESSIGLYKTELIEPRGPWRSLAQVELATAEWSTGTTTSACTPPSGTSHRPNTNRRSTLNPSPARWLEPTAEVSTEPGTVHPTLRQLGRRRRPTQITDGDTLDPATREKRQIRAHAGLRFEVRTRAECARVLESARLVGQSSPSASGLGQRPTASPARST
ncbi:integrase core domain-containing protein [Plantactinospora sp. WMMB782]|uniref:integrase core domain-containing protein n=1 Tax=Plantactinospora sp. WMMB782 TaxID=3404121 RepID=UPI003B94F0B8